MDSLNKQVPPPSIPKNQQRFLGMYALRAPPPLQQVPTPPSISANQLRFLGMFPLRGAPPNNIQPPLRPRNVPKHKNCVYIKENKLIANKDM